MFADFLPHKAWFIFTQFVHLILWCETKLGSAFMQSLDRVKSGQAIKANVEKLHTISFTPVAMGQTARKKPHKWW